MTQLFSSISKQFTLLLAGALLLCAPSLSSAADRSSNRSPVKEAITALPSRVASVMQKFDQFERTNPSRAIWEAKRRDVLLYLRANFDQETAKANLESSVAIRNAAKSLTKRSYEDVKLRNALADIAFDRL